MNINEASDFFINLINETDKESEIRIYENFIGILSDLKNRKLKKKELQMIEKEFDIIELKANPENSKKYYKQKLSKLKNYLKDEFSLYTEGLYTESGILFGLIFGSIIGMAFGVIYGVYFLEPLGTYLGLMKGLLFGLVIGLEFGMIFGLIIGRVWESNAKKKGRY